MATGSLQLRLGHGDHGRELTYEEFMAADYEEGYRYELIEGRLYVSPLANLPHAIVERYVHEALLAYKSRRGSVIKEVFTKARIFVPSPIHVTCPEPDLSVYFESVSREQRWQDISPLIVVEVISPDNADKDNIRNVDLYHRVPSIREYWIFDRCDKDDGPTLRVYHRSTERQKWKFADYGPRNTYTTELLPGFKLPVCPPK